MSADLDLAAVRDYYARGREQERLDQGSGRLEFERTKEIISRHLPAPPAVVADIGGGPGRYALWLAGLGYQVVHRDLMDLHVRQLAAAAADAGLGIESAIGDARQLDLAAGSADAVLLLGPLYHLVRRQDRLQALAEARRVVRPGGRVYAAAISRWAPRMDGVLRSRIPEVEALLPVVERTGRMPPTGPGSFCGYAHRPGQLRAELTAAGFRTVELVSVEGPAYLLDDLAQRLDDDEERRVVLDTARTLERLPELLGIGPHLLASAR
jgi:SAM-dependent methyltransferase